MEKHLCYKTQKTFKNISIIMIWAINKLFKKNFFKIKIPVTITKYCRCIMWAQKSTRGNCTSTLPEADRRRKANKLQGWRWYLQMLKLIYKYSECGEGGKLLTIANPTSAFFSAGPSLVPSPVTATTCLWSTMVLSMIPKTETHMHLKKKMHAVLHNNNRSELWK